MSKREQRVFVGYAVSRSGTGEGPWMSNGGGLNNLTTDKRLRYVGTLPRGFIETYRRFACAPGAKTFRVYRARRVKAKAVPSLSDENLTKTYSDAYAHDLKWGYDDPNVARHVNGLRAVARLVSEAAAVHVEKADAAIARAEKSEAELRALRYRIEELESPLPEATVEQLADLASEVFESHAGTVPEARLAGFRAVAARVRASDGLRDLLRRAVKEDVDVRVIKNGVGSYHVLVQHDDMGEDRAHNVNAADAVSVLERMLRERLGKSEESGS